MIGVLSDDVVEVRDQSEGNRLYGRGNYGYPRSGGGVDLDLMEAVYLSESHRLDVVTPGGDPVPFESLFSHAAAVIEGFDVKYLVYRDLRNSARIAKFESGDYDISVFPHGKNMTNSRPEFMVRAVSEWNAVDLGTLMREVDEVSARKRKLLYGVLDEDGDVEYYSLSQRDPFGKVYPGPMSSRPAGRLVKGRVFVYDLADAEALKGYGFYGRSMVDALHLSLIEALYLIGKGRLAVTDPDDRPVDFDELMDIGCATQHEFRIRYLVYSDLRERGLVVRTGFKYGTHFRVYQSSPEDVHARYLVHAVEPDTVRMWQEVSKTVRLSRGVRKDVLFALVKKNSVEYLEFRWYRPARTKQRPSLADEPVEELRQVPEPARVEVVDVVVPVPARGDQPGGLHLADRGVGVSLVESEDAVGEGHRDLLLREPAAHGEDVPVGERQEHVELRVVGDPHGGPLREADVLVRVPFRFLHIGA